MFEHVGVPKYMLYAQIGPLEADFFTTQAWSDEELESYTSTAPSEWDVLVYTLRED